LEQESYPNANGADVYGRLFNVIGDYIGLGNLPKQERNGMSIHRQAPKFEDLSTSSEVLFTSIKVIDLIEPYSKGGKIGCSVVLVLVKQY
jgi:F-type H+-transporting ATPase subunit beta